MVEYIHKHVETFQNICLQKTHLFNSFIHNTHAISKNLILIALNNELKIPIKPQSIIVLKFKTHTYKKNKKTRM